MPLPPRPKQGGGVQTITSWIDLRGSGQGQVTILAEGVTAREENRELFVLQKLDGAWRIARYMFNKMSPE